MNTARFDWRIGNHLMAANMGAPALTRVHEGLYQIAPALAAVARILAAKTAPATYAKTAAADTFLASTTATLLKLTTASTVAVGDCLEDAAQTGEWVLVTDISAAPVYTVQRAVAGSTAAAHLAGATWNLVADHYVPAHQPDVARILAVTGSAAASDSVVKIFGTDFAGGALEEDITANAAAQIVGTKAFASVSDIFIGVRGGATNTISVDTGALIGLPVILADTSYASARFNGSPDAGTVYIDATLAKCLYSAAGTFNGSKILALLVKVFLAD